MSLFELNAWEDEWLVTKKHYRKQEKENRVLYVTFTLGGIKPWQLMLSTTWNLYIKLFQFFILPNCFVHIQLKNYRKITSIELNIQTKIQNFQAWIATKLINKMKACNCLLLLELFFHLKINPNFNSLKM